MNSTTASEDKSANKTLPGMPITPDLSTLLPWALAFALVAVFVILGNSLVILCFIKKKALRTHTNYFIVSLSVADLFVGVISAPWWIVVMFVNYHAEGWSVLLQNIWLIFDILGGVSSILHLIALSWDRLCAILWPLNHRLYSSKRYIGAVVCTWTVAITVGGLSVIGKEEPLAYNVTVIALFFFLPLVIICVTQGVIVSYIRNKILLQGNLRCRLRKDIRVAKTIGIMIGIFVIGWLPFFALSLASYINPPVNIPSHAVFAVKLLQYGNSAANPALYAHKFPHFRKAYAAILCSCFPIEKIVKPFRTLSSRLSRSTMTSSVQASLYENAKGVIERQKAEIDKAELKRQLDSDDHEEPPKVRKVRLPDEDAIEAIAISKASPLLENISEKHTGQKTSGYLCCNQCPSDSGCLCHCVDNLPLAKVVNASDTSDEESTLVVVHHEWQLNCNL